MNEAVEGIPYQNVFTLSVGMITPAILVPAWCVNQVVGCEEPDAHW